MADIRILVVEDESIVAKDIEIRLKNLGYSVCGISSSGKDAIIKAHEMKPDLILMDVMLKNGIDGIAASEKIKETFNVPVIYITAYGDENTLQRAKITEPFGYILKPFEERELHINIEIALYKHNIEKKLRESEQWLSTTLKSIGDAVITTDTGKNITFMNPVAENITGWTKEQATGKPLSEVFKIFDDQKHRQIEDPVTAVLNGSSQVNRSEDVILINRQGQEISITSNASPIKDYNEIITGIVLIFHDITEKKQTDEILKVIIEGTSASIGDEFFKSLVRQLAKTFNVFYAFVCELVDPVNLRSQVIAAWQGNDYGTLYEYGMKETPCEKINGGKLIFYPEHVRQLFPNDKDLQILEIESYMSIPIFDSRQNIMGHMGVLHKKPLPEKSTYEYILKFFAERAAAELQRKKTEEFLRKSEEKYKDLANSLPQTIFEMDEKANLSFANTYAFETFGYTPEDLNSGLNGFDMIAPGDQGRARENIIRILNGEKLGFNEYICQKKDKTLFPVLVYSTQIINEQNMTVGLRGIVIDISELRKAENALRDSEERYTLTIKGTNDGFWDWNIKTNEIIYSSRWKNMLGYEEDEIENDIEEWFSRIHPDDLASLREKLESYLSGLIIQFETEFRILNKDCTYRWMLCRGNAVRDLDGNAYRMAGAQTDITEHKSTENMLEKLLHNVSHDSLTGLPNRALFLDRLDRSIIFTRRKKDFLFAVLFVDLDRFKIINDSLGHSFGNLVLIETSRKLQSCLRPEDTIARIGGDEFGILLDDIGGINDATRVAVRIQEELKSPLHLNNHEIFITASIGIAISSTTHEQAEELLRDADLAMFRAKTLGRARHELFDSGMHTHAIEILQLETDLRRAVDRQEFTIFYQPIISLSSGKITGFEALLRWLHPSRGLVSSDEFIPVAEETGLIVPIGSWVLREACIQIKKWQKIFVNDPPLTISVNISGKQFSHPNLIEQVIQIINETEIVPENLKMEITESTIMENAETARKMLRELRDLNIQLQIDDFGTGYSSLSYLHRFPVNTLKIDRSFVSRIGSNDENLEIVKTIVLLARNLNMNVIAEGIETAEQLLHLRTLECDHGQGYFFSRPMNTDIIEKLLESDPVW